MPVASLPQAALHTASKFPLIVCIALQWISNVIGLIQILISALEDEFLINNVGLAYVNIPPNRILIDINGRKEKNSLRPCHPESARSRLISEANQGQASLVLGWEHYTWKTFHDPE